MFLVLLFLFFALTFFNLFITLMFANPHDIYFRFFFLFHSLFKFFFAFYFFLNFFSRIILAFIFLIDVSNICFFSFFLYVFVFSYFVALTQFQETQYLNARQE